jgi:Sugar phosphate permease
MVISTSIPFIAKDLDLSTVQKGAAMSAFFISYALMQFPAGILADKFGPRITMLIGVAWWTLFTVLTGTASTFAALIAIRVAFGLGEGLFPTASSKAISTWFPLKERGTANSIMITSQLIAPALAPLFVVSIVESWSWRIVYFSLLIPGLIILPLIWLFIRNITDNNSRISAEELDEIRANESVIPDNMESKQKMIFALKNQTAWKCFFVIFFANMTTWGLMSWLPTYMLDIRGFSTSQMGMATSIPFAAAVIGTFGGGFLSDKLFSKNRKLLVIGGYLAGAVALYLTYNLHSDSLFILCQTFAFFAVSIGTSSFWTIPLTVLPESVIGSSMGIVYSGAQFAGFIAPLLIGFLVTLSGGSYNSTFLTMGGALIAAALVSSTIGVLKTKQQEVVKI